jgi:hypothetical protein
MVLHLASLIEQSLPIALNITPLKRASTEIFNFLNLLIAIEQSHFH